MGSLVPLLHLEVSQQVKTYGTIRVCLWKVVSIFQLVGLAHADVKDSAGQGDMYLIYDDGSLGRPQLLEQYRVRPLAHLTTVVFLPLCIYKLPLSCVHLMRISPAWFQHGQHLRPRLRYITGLDSSTTECKWPNIVELWHLPDCTHSHLQTASTFDRDVVLPTDEFIVLHTGHHNLCHLLRRDPTVSFFSFLIQHLQLLLIFDPDRGLDQARIDRRHPDAVAFFQVSQTPHQGLNSVLGDAVHGKHDGGDLSGHTGNVDNRLGVQGAAWTGGVEEVLDCQL